MREDIIWADCISMLFKAVLLAFSTPDLESGRITIVRPDDTPVITGW
jgi:hypothetical protein